MPPVRPPRFSKFRARDGAFLATGAFSVFAVGGVMVRAVFSCVLDGTVFWTAAGSLGIIAGAIVAYWQLKNLGDNERVKNTLAFLDRFKSEGVDKHCIAITSYASGTQENVRDVNFRIYFDAKLGMGEVNNPERAMRAAHEFSHMADRYVEVHNYFTTAATLLDRRLLDEGLFFSIMGQTVIDVNFAGGRVMEQVGKYQGYDLSALNVLSRRAIQLDPSLTIAKMLTHIEAADEASLAAETQ